MPVAYRCNFCRREVKTSTGVKRHIRRTPACYKKWQVRFHAFSVPADSIPGEDAGTIQNQELVDELFIPPDSPPPRPSKRARVDDASSDSDSNDPLPSSVQYVQPYPSEHRAGEPINSIPETCPFEAEHQRQEAMGEAPYAPFDDEDEWDLAKWMMKNLRQGQIDEYLKLPITQKRTQPSYHNKYNFLQKIDSLPTGPDWGCEMITPRGLESIPKSDPSYEELELWMRDAGEIIQELFANPAFRDHMSYAPEKVFEDADCAKPVFNEMSSGEWWWDVQGKLPPGATVAPIILASDQTKLSNFRGDKKAWPVYLSVGNIDKGIRRQPSSNAMILAGYIPVPKLEHLPEKERAEEGYRLFHYCMRKILGPLYSLGRTGMNMLCPDGLTRRVYPILAAYIADHPEQCLIACCKENRCPRCTVQHHERGNYTDYPFRDTGTTVDALHSIWDAPEASVQVKLDGLRAVYQPFWEGLAHCDIFSCFTPDLLHQLHKGVFYDHLVQWCITVIGEDEFDARFQALPDFPGLRHFKKGISSISQWTGSEFKTMERVFIGVLGGAVNRKVAAVARALLDFIYFAQLQTHTSDTLDALESALATFHKHKSVFEELEIRKHFNIPKIHAMKHYVASIRSRGTADGFNTETSERLHIDYAKEAYRASNKRDYTIQMARWLQRQEALVRRSAYLAWVNNINERVGEKEEPSGSDSDTDDSSESELDSAPTTTRKHRPIVQSDAVGYQLAIRSPPGFCNLSVTQLEARFSAAHFLPAFATFLQSRLPHCPIVPSAFDRFDCYKRLVLHLPANPYAVDPNGATQGILRYSVRAVPSSSTPGRRIQARRSHFDTALILDRNPSGSQIRVGRVRIIFKLPRQFGYHAHPLAFVQWFTPLGRPDPITGMYKISHSTRNRLPHSAIISVDEIIRPCHLIPCFPAKMDPTWRSETVLDQAQHFFVNSYIDVDTFVASQSSS